MDATASFSNRSNAKRTAEQMIAKGIAPAVDYGFKPRDDGRFEIVWQTSAAAPATGEIETELAAPKADTDQGGRRRQASGQGAGRDLGRQPALPEALRQAVRPRPSRRVGCGVR